MSLDIIYFVALVPIQIVIVAVMTIPPVLLLRWSRRSLQARAVALGVAPESAGREREAQALGARLVTSMVLGPTGEPMRAGIEHDLATRTAQASTDARRVIELGLRINRASEIVVLAFAAFFLVGGIVAAFVNLVVLR